MSLVKNVDNPYDTSVTIKRLLKTGTVVNGTTHLFRLYAQLNNKYAKLRWEISPGESVFIKCEIETNAEGYIYGKTTGANIFVDKTNHKIQWRNGSTEVYSKPWDDKVHVIGWIGYVPNAQSLTGRGCRPFYDSYDQDAPVVTAAGLSSYDARICGATDTNDCIHSTGSWAIRLYEVYANAASLNGETVLRNFHYYVADNNGAGYLVNTLFDFGAPSFSNGSSQSSATTSNTSVNFPSDVDGYGVQLHDLRHICNTGYNDLSAILTEDGGLDTKAGWITQGSGIGQAEAPCTLTKSTDVRNFAFGLSGLPKPADWTIGNAGTQGELKLGRTPKWSIWNNSIKFGKYATDASPSVLKFNLFRKNDGTLLSEFDISVFEGYNNAADQDYPPFFSIGDDSRNILLETHNGMACTITSASKILGGNNNGYDERMAFKYTLATGAIGDVCLGNMPAWNYDKEDLVGSSATPGMARLATFGGGLIFKTVGAGTIALTLIELTDQTYTLNNVVWPYPLSSGSTTDVKNKFKVNGFSGEAFFRSNFTDYMQYELHKSGASSSFGIDVSMCMVKSATKTPNNSQIIDCSNFAPEQRVYVSANDNPHAFNAYASDGTRYYGDRLVVGDNGGIEYVNNLPYEVNIAWDAGAFNYHAEAVSRYSDEKFYATRALCCCFCLVKTDGTTINDSPEMYDNGASLFVSYADINVAATYSTDVYSGVVNKLRGFTKLVKNVAQSGGYYLPFTNQEVGHGSKKFYPRGWEDSTHNHIGAAMFMWDDLLHPGKTGAIAVQNDRPNVDRPAKPITAHLRVFKKSEAPHAWNFFAPNGIQTGTSSGNWHWDNSIENPFKVVGSYYFEFHIHDDCLIEAASTNAVDAYMSMYLNGNKIVNTTSDQTVIKTALTGRTITVYSQPAYEPNETRANTTEFSDAISAGYWQSNTEYRHAMTGWVLHLEVSDIPFWTQDLFGDGGGVGTSNYVRIRAEYTGSDTTYLNAKTFFIDIT